MTIPAGYSEVSFVYGGGGIQGEAVVTLGLQNILGGTPADICDVMETLWDPVVAATSVSVVACTSIRVKNGPDATGPFAEKGVNLIGDQGTDAVPPQVAILVRKTTALGGRKGRGRFYLPSPPDVTVNTDGAFLQAFIDDTNGILETFRDDAVTGNLPPVLLHEDATAPSPITALLMQARTGSQRRRNRR